MTKKRYKVGTTVPSWGEGKAQTITFVVTDDCNLRCKYCYMTHKISTARMNLETAKKFVDFMLEGNFNRSEAVIIEFIGGEPFIEIDLIDKISDYFKLRAFELDHPWYWNYRFSFSTNGVNYADAQVQAYIKKNYNKMSCGITLDGTKEKHDMQRVFPDGRGSYDTVFKNIGLYLSQFSRTTKITFSSDDLPLLKESIISLWNNGITKVSANVVIEDVWKEGDELIFEEQLKELADYVLDKKLYDKYICSFFDDSIGTYYSADRLTETSCGAGKMMAFGSNGNIYPCIRYKGYSLNKKKEWVIGNLDEGLDMEKVRPFMTATYQLQSDEECLNCEVAAGCSFCQGFNYDEAETSTNFFRTKYICKMHKARVKANNYYFAKLFNRYGIERVNHGERKRLYFLLADDYIDYCQHINKTLSGKKMDEIDILRGLEYAYQNFFEPIFIHSRNQFDFKNLLEYQKYSILHIVPAKFYSEAANCLNKYMLVFDEDSLNVQVDKLKNCMLNISQENIGNILKYVKKILEFCDRVNINITGLTKNFDAQKYKESLMLLKDCLINYYQVYGIIKEVNLITDLCFIKEHNNCKSGDRAFTLAPDGKIYVCSAFYSEQKGNEIGNNVNGITKLGDKRLYKIQNSPLCSICDAYQCLNCIHLNKNTTQEVNVSPSFQCVKGFIEREVARLYQQEMGNAANVNIIPETKHKEAFGLFNDLKEGTNGYYNYTDNYGEGE